MPILTLLGTFFSGLSSTTYIILGISLLISVGALWFHHNENQLQLKSSEITALQISNANSKEALAQAAKDTQTIQDIDNYLVLIQGTNAEQQLHLSDILGKLEESAIANPSLVEQKVNKASDNRNRCFALATGDIPLKGEINPVCPQLLPKQKAK